jgi:hypothetical protein
MTYRTTAELLIELQSLVAAIPTSDLRHRAQDLLDEILSRRGLDPTTAPDPDSTESAAE